MSKINLNNDLKRLSNKMKTFTSSQLIEKILQRNEGNLTYKGSIFTTTGEFTGRASNDKYIVNEEISKANIHWGTVNKCLSKEHFLTLYHQVIEHLTKKEEIFSFQGFAGANPAHRLPI